MKKSILVLIVWVTGHAVAASSGISILVHKRYLNIPVSKEMPRQEMNLLFEDNTERTFQIRLSDGNPDYWVYYDMSAFIGQTLTIRFAGSPQGLSLIYQDEQIAGQDSLYTETYRPQFHFSVKRGWQNDPNGLVFYDGEYHLFYQYNPYETIWENMHWGHAISKDLIHWEELSPALYPFELGGIFSGSVVVDYKNTAGFNKENMSPAMIAAFTTEKYGREQQSIAYSLNKGRSWERYTGNPILDTKRRWHTMDTRDPKVFWYDSGKYWVMVLFELNGLSIYTSHDMKAWEYQSHTTTFCECPELFELPIEGCPDQTKWVMYGGSGTYMLGTFNGKVFTPENGKYFYRRGVSFAAQTFNNIPASDGRRIEIAWGRISTPTMPFNQMMLIPTVLTLNKTKEGVRLCSNPVKEIDQLQQLQAKWENIPGVVANEYLKPFASEDCFRLKVTFRYWDSRGAGLSLDQQRIVDYDTNHNLINDVFYSPENIENRELTADIFVDRTSVEVFIDDGRFSYVIPRMNGNFDPQARQAYWTPKYDSNKENKGLTFWGDNIHIVNLEYYTMDTIWFNNK